MHDNTDNLGRLAAYSFSHKRSVHFQVTDDPEIFAMIDTETGKLICYVQAMGEDWQPEDDSVEE